jgi:hypothetical protein
LPRKRGKKNTKSKRSAALTFPPRCGKLQAEAKGGTIVRWEKEGANFEAVIEKNGKQIGVEMDANGKC